jgi:hypothetical protein
MTADNNSTEDKPDPTPFKVYSMTNEARSKRMRGGPTREFASKSAGTTRFISAAGKFGPSDRGYV